MPEHEAYVEPFGGAASVLLRKPRSRLEVYNDLDDSLSALFRILRDQPEELANAVALTPFARSEFDLSYSATDDHLEQARRFLIRSHMGFGSNAANRRSGFRAAGLRAGVLPVHNWAGMPAVILEVANRLRGVVIEHRDAREVMSANDGAGTLHYVDPPYVLGTRGDASADYAHEMTDADHADLLAFLRGLKGKVMLSGYPHRAYDDTLVGWTRIEKAALADGARERVEVLWCNFEMRGALL